jgi:hypothetical protein
MQQSIAAFLLSNGSCNLPGLGLLKLATTPAAYSFGEQQISAPKSSIEFLANADDDNTFVDFLAKKNNVSTQKAKDAIADFVKKLNQEKSVDIANLGTLSKNSVGEIAFLQQENNVLFSPFVAAERIAHKNQAHQMLVGETQTNTVAMADYYADDDATARKIKKWHWFAIVSIIAAGLAIAANYFAADKLAQFKHLPNVTPEKTYKLIEAK